MGFFSFKTTDTNRSISNVYSSKGAFKVVMVDSHGEEYVEDNYKGYGIFGGQDIFILIAEMNGYWFEEDADEDMEYDRIRSIGIELYFSGRKDIKMPNIYEISQDWKNVPLENCEFQGYFY